MKRLLYLGIVLAVLVSGGVGTLAGVTLAQDGGWLSALVAEYSSVWKSAYDETAGYDLTPAGRDAVAERVLDAYITNQSASVGPGGNPVVQPSPTPVPVGPGGSPTGHPDPTPAPTPFPTPEATPTPQSVTITASDIDGYHSEYRMEIFVSSIGTNLAMSRVNTYIADRKYVKLRSDETLSTGIGGTPLTDRYYWSCNPFNGSTGERSYYATDEYNVGLPKTDLSSAPLRRSSDGRWLLRICNGDEEAPASTYRTSWGEFNRIPVSSRLPTPTPRPTPVPTLAPSSPTQATPTPTPEPTPEVTPTPQSVTITASEVDGYYSEYRIEIFVSSIGTNLSMSRVNTYTSNRDYVKLRTDGTLSTGIGGTPLMDRYYWSCNPFNGSTGESSYYATDEYNVSLPKTDLSNAPLRGSSDGRWLLRICNGDEEAPSSSYRSGWGKHNSF